MSIWFKHLSIRHKLLVLLASSVAFALLISSALIIGYTYKTQTKHSLHDLSQYARVMSTNIQASIVFHDDVSTSKILSSFEGDPHIMTAWVLGEDKNLLSRFVSQTESQTHIEEITTILEAFIAKNGEELFKRQETFHYITDAFMAVLQPVGYDGNVVGLLVIVSDTRLLKEMMFDFIVIQSAISIAVFGIIFLCLWWLQKPFSEPIDFLMKAIQAVRETKNYGTSVELSQKDEFGALYRHFNEMLVEIKLRDEKLLYLASTDNLTGLSNRHYAMEKIHTFVAKALRHQSALGIMMLDIDHFKRINDSYGHVAGDYVLQSVAKIILECAREYDMVARVGGEEFLVVCEACDKSSLESIAERIRHTVASSKMMYGGHIIKVTISVGGYIHIPLNHDVEVLLKNADDALYSAKSSGRNCVEIRECA